MAFEKSIGTRSTIANAIKKNSDINSKWISKIIETYPNLNADWLLTGKGSMEIDTDYPIELKEDTAPYGHGDRIELDVAKLKGTKDLHKLAFFLNQYFDELCEDEVFALFADRLKKDHQRELLKELRMALEKETKLNEAEIKRILISKPDKVNR